jgi:hypothetical protein
LDAGAATTGVGQSREGLWHTKWKLWLALYLTPDARTPATIPFHRITGNLTISGLSSEGFECCVLERDCDTAPDILPLLYGRSNKPKQLVVTSPMPVLFAATCQTPEWHPSNQPCEDRIRVNLEVAEADYQALVVLAPLRYLEFPGSTKWRLEHR